MAPCDGIHPCQLCRNGSYPAELAPRGMGTTEPVPDLISVMTPVAGRPDDVAAAVVLAGDAVEGLDVDGVARGWAAPVRRRRKRISARSSPPKNAGVYQDCNQIFGNLSAATPGGRFQDSGAGVVRPGSRMNAAPLPLSFTIRRAGCMGHSSIGLTSGRVSAPLMTDRKSGPTLATPGLASEVTPVLSQGASAGFKPVVAGCCSAPRAGRSHASALARSEQSASSSISNTKTSRRDGAA